MKVLMISSDRLIGSPGSAVALRMKEYGSLAEELHIVLLSDRKHGLSKLQLSSNVWVYPTNSLFKFFRPFDAVKTGERISADLITTQDPFECGWAGLKLKRLKGIPLEVQLHTDPYSPYFAGLLNSVRKYIAGKVLPAADSVRVVMQSIGAEVAERCGIDTGKISVLPIYVERKKVAGEPKFDLHDRYGFPRIVLAVARLAPEKRLDLAVKAVALLDNAGLVIVGAGPEEPKLRKLAEHENAGSRVIFAGWQEDLSSYYKTADALIQTSEYEGYGLSLVEAGLCSLPVVTTNVGIASSFESGKEIIIAEPTPEAFAKGLGYLFGSEIRRKDIGIQFSRAVEAEVPTKEAFLTALKENWTKLAVKKT